MTTSVMIILEIMLPKLALLRWYGLNLIEFLPKFYLGLGTGTILSIFVSRYWLNHIVPVLLAFSILIACAVILVATDLNIAKYLAAVPFVPVGVILGRAFAEDNTHSIYAVDLAGIAFGVVALGFGLSAIGGETLLLLCIVIPIAYCIWWFSTSAVIVFVIGVLILVGVAVQLSPQSPPWDFYRLRASLVNTGDHTDRFHLFTLNQKAQGLEYVEIAATKWDLVARTDVGRTQGSPLNYHLGPMYCELDNCLENPRYQDNTGYAFYYNGQFINSISPEFFLRTDFTLAATGASALVIGVGGGADLPSLYQRGVRDVMGAEINRAAVRLMQSEFLADHKVELYQPDSILPLDGRAVVSGRSDIFDIIMLNGAELYLPMPYSRVYLESYLYTVEAFREYFRALSDDGVLYVAKFGSFRQRTNEEAYKIILTAMSALYQEGITEPEKHLNLISIPLSVRFLDAEELIAIHIWRQPMDNVRYEEIRQETRPPFEEVYAPLHLQASPPGQTNYLATAIQAFGRALRQGDTEQYFVDQGEHLIPATDDKPFFYRFSDVQLYNARNLKTVVMSASVFIFVPVLLLLGLFLFSRKYAVPAPFDRKISMMPSFLSIGLIGFLFGMMQATIGQNFYVFLGSPVYSLLAIFCTFPAFSAIASISTRKAGRGTVIGAIAVVIVGLICAQEAWPMFVRTLEISNSFVRILIVSLAFMPIAYAMGVLFPWLVSPYRKADGRIVSLLYAWNTGFVVIGTMIALIMANNIGFRATMYVLILGYVALAALVLMIPKTRSLHPDTL